jgi:hypothetical protein
MEKITLEQLIPNYPEKREQLLNLLMKIHESEDAKCPLCLSDSDGIGVNHKEDCEFILFDNDLQY